MTSYPRSLLGRTAITIALTLLAFMAMARLKSIESLRYCAPGEWGKLLGLDRVPEVRTLRAKIQRLAQDDHPSQWSAELCERWMAAAPEQAAPAGEEAETAEAVEAIADQLLRSEGPQLVELAFHLALGSIQLGARRHLPSEAQALDRPLKPEPLVLVLARQLQFQLSQSQGELSTSSFHLQGSAAIESLPQLLVAGDLRVRSRFATRLAPQDDRGSGGDKSQHPACKGPVGGLYRPQTGLLDLDRGAIHQADHRTPGRSRYVAELHRVEREAASSIRPQSDPVRDHVATLSAVGRRHDVLD